jgi:hypothetical protein
MMLPVAQWIATTGRNTHRIDGAAWYVDYVKGSRHFESAALYKSSDGSQFSCGQNCERTCLGDLYLNQVIPLWP